MPTNMCRHRCVFSRFLGLACAWVFASLFLAAPVAAKPALVVASAQTSQAIEQPSGSTISVQLLGAPKLGFGFESAGWKRLGLSPYHLLGSGRVAFLQAEVPGEAKCAFSFAHENCVPTPIPYVDETTEIGVGFGREIRAGQLSVDLNLLWQTTSRCDAINDMQLADQISRIGCPIYHGVWLGPRIGWQQRIGRFDLSVRLSHLAPVKSEIGETRI